MAFRVFADYKWAAFRARRLKQRLDDHPSVLELWSTVHERNASRLLSQIKGLAGFWVKVGQYLSTRADVMPPEYLVTLAELQDSMPPKPLEDVLSTIQEELDAAGLARIESIDPEPLSTASLAQVHRARLVETEAEAERIGSREVVLKVQHKGVASLMLQDMENLRVILELLARTDPDLDVGPVIREYNQEVRKELDFRTEAEHMEEVRRVLSENRATVILPETIDGLVTERVLVMEYCEGFPVKDTASMDRHGVDRALLLERICEAWAVQMHVGGLFNADPHGANILVSTAVPRDASVPVLLDFGLTKRLDPPMKLAFARLMHASYEGDVDALLQSFDEMGLKTNNKLDPLEGMANMQRGFGDTVPQTRAREASKQQSAAYKRRMEARRADEGLEKGQKLRNPVEAWPAELVFFGRVTAMLRGLCSRLEVRYPYLKTMALTARETIRDSVPLEEHATSLVHRGRSGTDTGTGVGVGVGVGVPTELEQRLLEALPSIEKEGHMVGLQLCVLRDGKEIANIAAGTMGVANPRPVTSSTLFNVFSVSKGLLAVGVLRLWQDGNIESLDDPVCKYWSEFVTKPNITVRHLLTHQAGLSDAYPEDATLDSLLDWSAMVQFMAEHATPSHAAGEEIRYHALTYAWLVGGLIEAVTKRPYEELFETFLQRNFATGTEAHDQRLFLAGVSKTLKDEEDFAILSVDRRGISQQTRNDETERSVKGKKGTESLSSGDKEEEEDEEERRKRTKRTLAKYRGMQHLMNPSVFNMRKVREAKLPSANGHASALSLARFFDAVIRPRDPILTPDVLTQARTPHRLPTSPSSEEDNAMLNDSQSPFGLGFQLHDFTLANGDKVVSIGHAGIGGSVVLAIPEEQVVVALTVNHLSHDNVARKRLLGIVFEELGWRAPSSLPVQQQQQQQQRQQA
eukprot:jgi/Psemu1/234462/estExt_Genewise1.C_160099